MTTTFDWWMCDDPAIMLDQIATVNRWDVSKRKLRLFWCAIARIFWNKLTPPFRRAVEIAEIIADGVHEDYNEYLRIRSILWDVNKTNPCDWGSYYSLDNAPFRFASHSMTKKEPDILADTLNHLRGMKHIEGDDGVSESTKADILREIFSDPTFQWVITKYAEGRPSYREIDNSDGRELRLFRECWRTPHVTGLVHQMYDSGDFFGMPILADALEEAGCDDERILNHCRAIKRRIECSCQKNNNYNDPDAMICAGCLDCNFNGFMFERSQHVRGCWVCDLILGLE